MNEEEKKPESVTAKQSNDKFAIVVSVFLILLIIGTAVANISGYVFRWEWVGVVDRKTGEIKTLWNWMDLLLVPFVLAAGAYLFNKSEKAHERKIAEQQRENERVLAAKRAKAELAVCRREKSLYAVEISFIGPYIVDRSTTIFTMRYKMLQITSHRSQIEVFYQSNLSPTSC